MLVVLAVRLLRQSHLVLPPLSLPPEPAQGEEGQPDPHSRNEPRREKTCCIYPPR